MTKYKLIEVETLEEVEYSGDVYDIQVEDDHSYTVGGSIAVHNSMCKTRQNTGVGMPQLYVLKEIRTCYPQIPLIADGGMKETGDICKAMKYADLVMLGSMLSGTSETPGHVFKRLDGTLYKVFGGSASGESKIKAGKENSFIEGAVKTVVFKGHVKYILREIKENLQSCCSYSNSLDLDELKVKGVLKRISESGRIESKL